MRARVGVGLAMMLGPLTLLAADGRGAEGDRVVLAVHGGAGTPSREELTPEAERAARDDLERALHAGFDVLSRADGTSVDAVEAAIRVFEDSPRFNAGKGAVFTHEGRNELDASIMDGATLRAGAVAGVTTVKNPIAAARAVMERSPHVLLAGPGADAFAREAGLEIVSPVYFWTEHRWNALRKSLEKEGAGDKGIGTVGAVALDRHGHLAAGTSTGGMTNKRYGRVGDSPIIGAGTYADDASCAVSATGHGEFFLRYVVAHDIAARVKYRGQPVAEAADEVVHRVLKDVGGEGGVIALDAMGRVATPFNSEGMFRGTITEDGTVHIAIFRD